MAECAAGDETAGVLLKGMGEKSDQLVFFSDEAMI